MEHVVKSFTIIDFLGIFTPGAILVLAFQHYIGGATAPFQSFFGENDAMLAVYFVALSYLCGSLLHQLGSLLEWLISKIVSFSPKLKLNMHEKHWENESVKAAYRTKFASDSPNSAKEKIAAGKEIFHYVQRKNRTQRLMTFSAFYTMSRTMVVALLAIILIILLSHKTTTLPIIPGCIFLIVFSIQRWWSFEKRSVDEAYLLFVTET